MAGAIFWPEANILTTYVTNPDNLIICVFCPFTRPRKESYTMCMPRYGAKVRCHSA